MNRILVNTPNTVYVEFRVGETLTDADGTVTVVVADSNGTVLSSGNATNEPSGVGLYSYQVPSQTQVKRVTITWSGTFAAQPGSVVQDYEVVGRFLFSLADLRAMDGLSDVLEFTTTRLIAIRDEVTDLFTDYCHTAWGRAYRSEIHDGVQTDRVLTDRGPMRALRAVKIGGVAQTLSNYAFDEAGEVRGPITKGFQNIVVEYEYGHDQVPLYIPRAGLRLARYWLLSNESSIPDRARMLTTEWGTFQLTNATENFITGLPEVDAVLNRFNERVPVIA